MKTEKPSFLRKKVLTSSGVSTGATSRATEEGLSSSPTPFWKNNKRAMSIKTLSSLAMLSVLLFSAPPAFAAVASGAAMTMSDYWRYFFAGGVCACLSHSLATPVDVVKTRQQTDPEQYRGLSVPQVFAKIVREEGPFMLLKGLGPTALGYLFEGAMKFGFYELAKPFIFQMTGGTSKLLDFLIAGSLAGTVAALALCPLEAARIRLVSNPKYAKGLFDAIPKMVTERGVFSVLFAGLPAQMAKQVPYTMVKQVSFDFLTAYAYASVAAMGMGVTPNIKWAITLSAALTAAFFSTLASQPGDMLLSSVNKYKEDGSKPTTAEAARDILSKDGWKGLFRGTKARILHTGAIVTAQLTLYDIVKQLCGIAATGST